MCGIVGIVSHSPVAPLIVDALKRLEYRGYDSAGVATIEHGELSRRRAEGKLINLERRLREEPLDGTIGIGHTRWATHGVPYETNAPPHFSNGVPIGHNGISEKFADWLFSGSSGARTKLPVPNSLSIAIPDSVSFLISVSER